MSTLTSFKDHPATQCWARIEFETGEPLFICREKTGTTVRVSKHGLLGRKLFKEGQDGSEFVDESLWSVYSYITQVPFDLKSVGLRGFVAAALCSSSVEDLVDKIVATRTLSRCRA